MENVQCKMLHCQLLFSANGSVRHSDFERPVSSHDREQREFQKRRVAFVRSWNYKIGFKYGK